MNFIVRRRRFFALFFTAAFMALLAWAGAMQLSRPIPEVTLVESASVAWTPPAASAEIIWPALGQAAIAVDGVGTVGESPNQAPRPIASLTKMMTAYVILKGHPLAPGEPGAEVEFTDADVQNYLTRQANAESVVPVTTGGRMTERELLRGLMLASGNNLADVLAQWHSGSVEAFVAQMNQEALALGMTNTTYADPSGVHSGSVSTAHDQVLLAQAAMADPTFASIVRETEATLPGAGVVYNTNSELGNSGIVGIKTGWTEEAGACFVFSAEWDLEGQKQHIIGAVMGQDTLADAFDRTRELIVVGGVSTSLVRLAAEGDTIGQLKTKWGSTTDAVLSQDVAMVLVPGLDVLTELSLSSSEDIESGGEIGTARFTAGEQVMEVPLRASSDVESPDLVWRLTRIK
jgi:serine-type D-Ala-D-Ala carboxypeptidase (penicillin-binding protein 5/6)